MANTVPPEADWKISAVEAVEIMTLYGPDQTAIVTIEPDGTVVWGDGYGIEDAAKALGNAFTLSAEIAAGVKKGTLERQKEMWDTIILSASENGSLTVEELIDLRNHTMILDKLKDE